MLLITTGPVTVQAYETYTRDDGQPMTRKDGSPVEKVLYQVEGEFKPRETTLDASVNGQRADVGAVVSLTMETDLTPDARTGRSGRPYVAWVEKKRVVKMSAAR